MRRSLPHHTHQISMKIGLTLLCSAFLTSCTLTNPRWQMQAPCPEQGRGEILDMLAGLVSQEGMDITLVNLDIGILQASMFSPAELFTPDRTNSWNFNVRNDTIYAIAKQTEKKAGKIEEKFLNDENADDDDYWFWNVRNGVASLCTGYTVRFVRRN